MNNARFMLIALIGVDILLTIIFAILLLIGATQGNPEYVKRGVQGIAATNLAVGVFIFFTLPWFSE